jgi:hypothetical protein
LHDFRSHTGLTLKLGTGTETNNKQQTTIKQAKEQPSFTITVSHRNGRSVQAP